MSEPRRLEPSVWEIPVGFVEGMRVPGIVFASDELFARALLLAVLLDPALDRGALLQRPGLVLQLLVDPGAVLVASSLQDVAPRLATASCRWPRPARPWTCGNGP